MTGGNTSHYTTADLRLAVSYDIHIAWSNLYGRRSGGSSEKDGTPLIALYAREPVLLTVGSFVIIMWSTAMSWISTVFEFRRLRGHRTYSQRESPPQVMVGFFRHERLRGLAMSLRPVTRQPQWATTQHNEMAENEYDVTEHCNTVAVMVHYREAKEIVDPTPPVEPTPNEIRQRALNNAGAPHKFGSKEEYSRDRKARRGQHYKGRTGIDHTACARARSVHLCLTYCRNMYIRVREQDQLFQGI